MHRKISNGITYIPGILMLVEGLNENNRLINMGQE